MRLWPQEAQPGAAASGPGSLAPASPAASACTSQGPSRIPLSATLLGLARRAASGTKPHEVLSLVPQPPARPLAPFCLPVPCMRGDSASQGRERDAGWHSVKELIEK